METHKYFRLEDLKMGMSEISTANFVNYFTANLSDFNPLSRMIIKSLIRNNGVNADDLRIIADSMSEFYSEEEVVDRVYELLELIEELELEEEDELNSIQMKDRGNYIELNPVTRDYYIDRYEVARDIFMTQMRFTSMVDEPKFDENLVVSLYKVKILEELALKGAVGVNYLASQMASDYCAYSEEDLNAYNAFKKNPDLGVYNGQIPPFVCKVILGPCRGLNFEQFEVARDYVLNNR
ncbi:hypothetical protein GF354_01460 [Candidatus Peregrinibacteria bacterium]|nr:hypothetical protein [Candidatus Peregrinibacteria bacterium]